MKYISIQIFIFVLLVAGSAFAQPGLQRMQEYLQKEIAAGNRTISLKLNPKNNSLGSVLFSGDNRLLQTDAVQWLSGQLQLRQGIDVLLNNNATPFVYAGMQIEKFQQYYQGIKVEHGMVNVAGIDGKLSMIQLEFYSIPDNFKVLPLITGPEALEKAIQYTGAAKYVWQGYTGTDSRLQKPTGELVIVDDYLNNKGTVCLAYKFDIYASDPVISSKVYVNAMNGQVVLADNNNKGACFSSNPAFENHKPLPSLAAAENERPLDNSPLFTNTPGLANTLYSGTQTIYTDYTGLFYYRLSETRNLHEITTKDYHGNSNSSPLVYDQLATEIKDLDNAWTSATEDNAALEAQFNMQVLSDYWKEKHSRISYDNAASPMYCYVHVNVGHNAAQWAVSPLTKGMYFGDGNQQYGFIKETGAHVGLDITAHEMGHAVVSSADMPMFVSGGEPGALNEGFSDIWGACIENYGVAKYPGTNASGVKKPWLMAEESMMNFGVKGLRDMQNPKFKEQPDTYGGNFFVDDLPGQDFVHVNSSVLTKWFSLITAGGTGTNDHGYHYNIPGLGFGITDTIAYNTELLLTPNATYTEVMHTSINYAIANYQLLRPNVVTNIINAWRAVGVLDTLYFDTSNTRVFGIVNNSFTTVAVGKGGYVWAGTSTKGLFRYDGTGWKKYDNSQSDSTLVNKVSYRCMQVDKKGGIWIAQSGYSGVSGSTNSSGGVYYFEDTTFKSKRFYTATTSLTHPNLISRNVTSLWVDNVRNNAVAATRNKVLPQVWAVSMAQTTSSNNTSGGVAMGITDTINIDPVTQIPYNDNFKRLASSPMYEVEIRTTSRGAQTIGGNSKEVWVYEDSNSERSLLSWGFDSGFYNGSPKQIIRFNAANGDSISCIKASNTPVIDSNFTAKAIYFDRNGNRWIGLLNKGIVVQDQNDAWYKSGSIITPAGSSGFTDIFPTNTVVYNNAISGDSTGNVYFGTSDGLVVYSGGPSPASGPSPLTDYKSYKRYTINDGLPSNFIRGIAYDSLRKGVWLATDSGVVLWRFNGPDRSLTLTQVDANSCDRDLTFTLKTKGKFFAAPTPNDIRIELSDAAGSFASPTILNTYSGIATNTAQTFPGEVVQIPLSVPNGNNYFIRAVSTNPPMIGGSSRPLVIQKVVTTLPSAGAQLLTANLECEDALGWTHYYFDNNTTDPADDVRLLSIKKNSNDIGAVGDGTFKVEVAATPMAGSFNAGPIINPLVTNQFVSMNRYWHVTPSTQPATPVNVRFYYNTQDLQDINGGIAYGPIVHTNLVFYKTDGNPNPTTNLLSASYVLSYVNGPAPTTTAWAYTPINATVHQAEFMVAGFSGGGGGSTPNGGPLNTLPLQLLSFTARVAGTGTLLQWQTAMELNTSYFEIQRSVDGTHFTGIATVQASGNSSTQKNYQTTDAIPVIGRNYYRLKMVDRDGQTTYSPTRLITFNKSGIIITVYPNPAKNILNIENNLPGKQLSISITDITGRRILQWQEANNALLQIPITSLSKGTYILQINDGTETVNQKLVKE